MSDQFEPYDYAWKTSGWNVQAPTFPPIQPPDIVGDPGLPDDVPKVLVVGGFEDLFSGMSVEGTFDYRTTTTLLYTTTGTEIEPSIQSLRFTAAIPLQVLLPATDSSVLIGPEYPTQWTYDIRLTVQGVTRTATVSLPMTGSPVNVWTLLGDPT